MTGRTVWYRALIVVGVLIPSIAQAAGTIIKQRPPSTLRQCSGDTLVLSVQAEPPVGEVGLQYQWYKDGERLTDGGRIRGTQTNTLQIVDVTPADAGLYTVVVTTVPSGATEDAQTQVQIAQPVQITQQPSSQELCAGQQLTLSVQASGSIDGYQWYHNGSIVAGATEATYTTTAAPSDAGEWWCVVISPCGNVISERALVQVNVPPTIVTEPTGTAVCRGSTFTLQVEASGTEPLQYQWFQDGSPIAGATQSAYQGTATQTATYSVQVTNACGSVQSQSVTVRVKEAPQITQQPQGGTFAPGSRVELSVQATGESPLSYQWYRNSVPIPGATNATYVIANMSSSDEGEYFCVVTNECGSDTSDVVRVVLTGIAERLSGSGVILWAVSPHPVVGNATIRYQVLEEGWVRLSLLDLYGRPIAVLADAFMPVGEYSQPVNPENLGLASGSYIYQLETSAGVVRQLMVVVR